MNIRIQPATAKHLRAVAERLDIAYSSAIRLAMEWHMRTAYNAWPAEPASHDRWRPVVATDHLDIKTNAAWLPGVRMLGGSKLYLEAIRAWLDAGAPLTYIRRPPPCDRATGARETKRARARREAAARAAKRLAEREARDAARAARDAEWAACRADYRAQRAAAATAREESCVAAARARTAARLEQREARDAARKAERAAATAALEEACAAAARARTAARLEQRAAKRTPRAPDWRAVQFLNEDPESRWPAGRSAADMRTHPLTGRVYMPTAVKSAAAPRQTASCDAYDAALLARLVRLGPVDVSTLVLSADGVQANGQRVRLALARLEKAGLASWAWGPRVFTCTQRPKIWTAVRAQEAAA